MRDHIHTTSWAIYKHIHTHTHLRICTKKYGSIWCVCAHEDTHMCTHTGPDYFAYLLSKQSFLGSLLLTSIPHQSINPDLRDPVKPLHLERDLKLVCMFLLTCSHHTADFKFKMNAVCSKERLPFRFVILKQAIHSCDIRLFFFFFQFAEII